MTKEQLEIKLQTTTEREFKESSSEIAEAFPGTHDWYQGQSVPNFGELTPWAFKLGWNVSSDKPVDQELKKFPDIIFSRV